MITTPFPSSSSPLYPPPTSIPFPPNHTISPLLPSIPPVLTVPSPSTVSFSCLDASNGQILPTSTLSALHSLVFAQLDQVNGPVYLSGAQPGDTLQVDVLSVKTADWGWTAIIPGFGLLADEFPEPALKIWSLHRSSERTGAAGGGGYSDSEHGYAWFDEAKGIKIPLKPFAGEMGVAPGKPGAHSTIPPYRTGGNVDTRHLSAGATLFLPVEVEGALFSIGVRVIAPCACDCADNVC